MSGLVRLYDTVLDKWFAVPDDTHTDPYFVSGEDAATVFTDKLLIAAKELFGDSFTTHSRTLRVVPVATNMHHWMCKTVNDYIANNRNQDDDGYDYD